MSFQLRIYNFIMTIITTFHEWVGYCRGLYGSRYYLTPIKKMQSGLIDEIYELLNGNDDIEPRNPMSMVAFIENNEQLKMGLMVLLVGDKYQMGRETDKTIPTSIYSYAYVAASILLDSDVDADLSFGLSDVSEKEYLQYYQHLMSKK